MIALAAVIVAVGLARRARTTEGRRRLGLWGGVAAALVVGTVGVLWPGAFVLRKTLGVLAMPMGLLWMGLIGAALLLWLRRRDALAATLGLAAASLTVVGSEPLADLGLAHVEHGRGNEDPFEGPALDALIVLGGGTASTPAGGVQVGASGDRLVLAARLYHRGRARRLITSGSPSPGFVEHDSARATRTIWTELGVPEDAIVLVEGARTTSEEAELIVPIVEERGWRRVGLLSSAVHLGRALPWFEAEGLSPEPIAADVRRDPVRWDGLYSLVPKGPAAADLHAVMWELVGRAVR